jgi:hypothetical protein
MKNILLIYISFLLIGCNKNEVKPKNVESQKVDPVEEFNAHLTVNENKIPFYDFDQVEYYKSHLSFEEQKLLQRNDTIGFKILMKRYPEKLIDNTFFEKLIQNYTLENIDPKLNDSISGIYSEKFSGEGLFPACDPFYRDILIFKKENKIVGISKICFECGLHWTIGSKRDVLLLGQKGDFEKLEKILSKK